MNSANEEICKFILKKETLSPIQLICNSQRWHLECNVAMLLFLYVVYIKRDPCRSVFVRAHLCCRHSDV